MDSFLQSRKPMVLSMVENYTDYESLLQESRPRILQIVKESFVNTPAQQIVIPPLNTDIRFSNVLPKHDPSFRGGTSNHPSRPHTHEYTPENFSWHIVSSDDDGVTREKKRLICPIQNQYMCGSCWAMAMAACISDCFVVGGTINWMPSIDPTYLMMVIPSSSGNGKCNGGNPASVALALETIPVSDSTCIDYSWCSNDKQLCTSASAAQHFTSTLGEKLNSNIPTASKQGACYFTGDKYAYKIDNGSEAFFINNSVPVDLFRASVKAHILDFGPPLAGYAVLRNFITGNFTDSAINQGVYFDRASYPSSISASKPLVFSDQNASEYNLSGLHAVRVVGWGIAKNVQYDNDKYGDVPYWWAANSWGPGWGNEKGFFKIAMYPYNKYAQFDTQINVQGFPVGGMILVRCTEPPSIADKQQIEKQYLDKIVRAEPDSYYKMTPQAISESGATNGEGGNVIPMWIYITGGVVVLLVLAIVVLRKR